MKSDNGPTLTETPARIIDRGRGPEVEGTRITVYAILDFILECWSPERIAAWFDLHTKQVEAAVEYIREHTIEVLTEYLKILERSERGNPPELQAKLDASHKRFRELTEQVRQIKARADTDIHELIQRYRSGRAQEDADATNHGGQ